MLLWECRRFEFALVLKWAFGFGWVFLFFRQRFFFVIIHSLFLFCSMLLNRFSKHIVQYSLHTLCIQKVTGGKKHMFLMAPHKFHLIELFRLVSYLCSSSMCRRICALVFFLFFTFIITCFMCFISIKLYSTKHLFTVLYAIGYKTAKSLFQFFFFWMWDMALRRYHTFWFSRFNPSHMLFTRFGSFCLPV